MARKKSAAKKAREVEAEKLKLNQELDQELKELAEQSKHTQKEDDETSEDEDDYGELITEDVEEGINKVLEAIRTGDKTLLDPTVTFFNDAEADGKKREKKDKPIYLKDYHRMQLLSGAAGKDEDEDLPKVKTYQEEKEEERNEILSQMKNELKNVESEDEDEDDEFFTKKKGEGKPKRALPNPDENEENFLTEFAKQHAWIPQNGDRIINLDKTGEEDDEEFDDAVEEFEHAYNHRYEDPNAAEIISYARNEATARREKKGRKKQRELKREEQKKLNEEKELKITKKKNEKINKLTDILEQIKNDYGADINEDLVKRISASLLDKDFDDSQWDTLLQDIFNEEFYNEEANPEGEYDDGEPAKPEWGEDDEIMKDFKPAGGDDESEEESEQEEEEDNNKEAEGSDEPPKKKVKKDDLKEKKDKKKEKKLLKKLSEKAIEENKLKIIEEVEEEREGRSKNRKTTFKYREVSPETFGLTTRDILVADDTQLNEYVSIKKYAPYKPKDQRVKDRRKLAKAKHLKEWRKQVFRNENGPQFDENDKEGDVKIPVPAPAEKKSKRSNKRKHHKLES